MDRKTYIVRGSEDGNLGVFSNVKKAHARAMKYLEQNGPVQATVSFCNSVRTPNAAFEPTMVERTASYANVCEKINAVGFCEIEVKGDRVTANIELFYLNQ